jgi:hypothetical protein
VTLRNRSPVPEPLPAVPLIAKTPRHKIPEISCPGPIKKHKSLLLVSSAKDAWSWLEMKGWALISEIYSKSKLTDILPSAMLSFKLPAKADTAIHSVAFLIQDQADKDFAVLITDKIINRVIDKLNTPVENLNDSVVATKSFLDTTSQQHASELNSLQGSIKQHDKLVKVITNSSENFSNPRGLTDVAWPPLALNMSRTCSFCQLRK